MMSQVRKFAAAALALLAAVPLSLTFVSCSGFGISDIMQGDKNVLGRSYGLDPSASYSVSVSGIRNKSDVHFNFVVDETLKDEMVITTDENVFKSLKIEIDGGKHTISVTGDSAKNYAPSEFEISIGVAAESITLEGDYTVRLAMKTPKTLNMKADGAVDGDIALDGYASVTVDAGGKSDFTLSGRTSQLALIAEGTSEISAYELSAEKASVTLAGDAKANVSVSSELDASVADSSSVTYKGAPTVRQTIKDLGTVVPYSG